MGDWVSVSEKKPPNDGTEFLAWVYDGPIVLWGMGGNSTFKSGGGYYDVSDITVWQPIDPPEKG